MVPSPTPIQGCYTVQPVRSHDARGFFSRLFDYELYGSLGFQGTAQLSLSWNDKALTLRGMHAMDPAYLKESKVVTCLRGSIYDVVVDIRPESATYLQWVAFTLTESVGTAVVIPPGCAHGFLTLEDKTQVLYMMDAKYDQKYERGLRWNDPALKIVWPAQPLIISPKDQSWAVFGAT